MRKDNLTICRLPGLIADSGLRDEVQAAVDVACVATKFARDWRNRRIAHRDLALAISSGAEPLASASRQQVGEAMDKVSEVIKRISRRYLDSDIAFHILREPRGAEALLYVIRDGLEADEARHERLRAGKLAPGDYGPPRAL